MSAPTSVPIGDLIAELAAVPGARPVHLREVEIGRGALQRLPELLARCRDATRTGPVVLLVDDVPKRRGDADLGETIRTLLGADVRTVVLAAPDGGVHADEATLEDALARTAGAGVLVSIGSGTVADIGKAVAARSDGLPHLIVQTALSVNGFADDQSVLLRNGVKRTTPSRWPDALIADTDVLAAAPAELNAAGVGDLMAMFTAPADWLLASRLGMGEGYSEPLVSIVRSNGPQLLRAAARLRERDPDSIECVARVLTLSGVSMGVAGATAPSSGAEHTISHLIEMAAARAGSKSAYHGAQVGVATVVATLVWQRVRREIAAPRVTLRWPDEDELEPLVRAAFDRLDPSGVMGEECWRLYRMKLARWQANRERLAVTDWGAVDAAVAPLLAEPSQIVEALTAAGTPVRFRDLDPPIDADTVRWALGGCHLMRDRFSVVDLAFFLGVWGPEEVDETLAEAARLGAGL